MLKNNDKKPAGYIVLTYPCRALEWIHIRKTYAACLVEFGFEQLCPVLNEILFAWRYHANMARRFYRPALVFKQFSFLQLLDENQQCMCGKSKRFARFLDSKTMEEISSVVPAAVHVRTVDMNIIHHKRLRQALAMGLNHIPMKPTSLFATTIATILDGFQQVALILQLDQQEFPIESALAWLQNSCLEQLKTGSRTNRFGFRNSGADVMKDDHASNEGDWLLQHLYCSGLDKAANNAVFICIKHIRLMALERLSSPDFLPCKENLIWLLLSTILELTVNEIKCLVPKLSVSY